MSSSAIRRIAVAATTIAAGLALSSASLAASAAVSIESFRFVPAAVTVNVGDSVTWTNRDAAQHTATAPAAFDTGTLSQGQSRTIVMATAGMFAYRCSIHPTMTGTVQVTGAAPATPAPTPPPATPAPPPPAATAPPAAPAPTAPAPPAPTVPPAAPAAPPIAAATAASPTTAAGPTPFAAQPSQAPPAVAPAPSAPTTAPAAGPGVSGGLVAGALAVAFAGTAAALVLRRSRRRDA